MFDELSVTPRLPRVPLERRVAAFAIDFGIASLISTLGGNGGYIVLYVVAWLILRVVVVIRNRGQSLGRWAMDMKVVDPKYRSTPTLGALAKRESLTGLGSLLVLIGLANLSPTNGWILFTPIPLLVDCGFAFADAENRLAYHDRFTRTVVAQTRRGYSLDIKVKKIIDRARQRVK
ncbi:RDD family protein [Leptolyngbya sp. FACHB-36]|uniref:RDD family protein n=1 Tax=Leptolyngbya sp. FACHB-36 TaxID=2692808 RepID=UPI001680FA4F|nr:RDD family protein [Leptolyngbya sp. FACHB-36]MBD2019464.1 RDD family protein [Leptolyngbya sp. FACHB-36]